MWVRAHSWGAARACGTSATFSRGPRIGSDCVLGQNVNVGPDVRIGNGVKIQNNVSIFEGVELADYVFCGSSCVFTNDTVPRARYPKKEQGEAGSYRPTLVDTGATIGANATVICGRHHRCLGIYRCRRGGDGGRPRLCPCNGSACASGGMGLRVR